MKSLRTVVLIPILSTIPSNCPIVTWSPIPYWSSNKIKNPLIKLPLKDSEDYRHIYHVFVIRCAKRDELEKYLNENGIGTVKHYPIPTHLQEAYKDLNIKEGSLPIAEEISKTVLSIPMYYGMTDEEVNYVIDKLNAFK